MDTVDMADQSELQTAIEELTAAVQAVVSRIGEKADKSSLAYVIGDMTILVSYRGEWKSSISYVANDVVSYNGGWFKCIEDSIGESPPSDKWASYAITDGQKRLLDLFMGSDTFATDHKLKNAALEDSVNALIDYKVADSVHYTAEEKSEEEKAQARKNIGARGSDDFDVMGEVEVVPSGEPVEADFPSIKWYVTNAQFGDRTLEWSVSAGCWREGDGLANIAFEEGQFKFYSVIGPATIGGYPQTPTWYETSYGNAFVLSVTKPAIGKVGSIARTSATSGVAKLGEDGVLTAATATDVPGLDKKRGLTDFDVAEAATGYVISNDIRDFECKLKVSETKWVESTDPAEYVQRGVVEFNSSGVGAHAYREYFDGTEWVHDVDFGTNATAKPTDATFYTSGGDLESTVTTQLSAAQKLVRTSATSGIAKIGEDGILGQATEGVDYLKTHQDISGKQNKITATGVLKGNGSGDVSVAMPSSTDGESADYRDPLDSTCHKTVSEAGEWSKVTKDGDVWSVFRQDTEWILLCNGSYYEAHTPKDVGDNTATSLTWVAELDWDKKYDITFTRTFTTFASKDHTFVTEDVMKANVGRMIARGDGRYEYVGALDDASARTYPREEA